MSDDRVSDCRPRPATRSETGNHGFAAEFIGRPENSIAVGARFNMSRLDRVGVFPDLPDVVLSVPETTMAPIMEAPARSTGFRTRVAEKNSPGRVQGVVSLQGERGLQPSCRRKEWFRFTAHCLPTEISVRRARIQRQHRTAGVCPRLWSVARIAIDCIDRCNPDAAMEEVLAGSFSSLRESWSSTDFGG